MAEERILYLLRNLNLNSEDFSGSFPSLNPHFLQDVAKSVSSLITDGDGRGSNRMGYIQLLKRLCVGEEGHVSVNGSNYETFIQASPLAKIRDDPDVHTFIKEINESEAGKERKGVLDEAAEFYDAKLALHKRRVEKLAFINDHNRKSFSDLDYTPSKKLENYTEIVQTLRGFKVVEESESEETGAEPHAPIERRQSDVKLAYAVLHLQSEQKDTVVQNLLTDLEGRRPLTEFEIEFLQYLFKTEVEYKIKLLDSFACLMERAVIELCTKLLDNVDSAFDENNDPHFRFLMESARLADAFQEKILSIFYELFALGAYNEVLLFPIWYIVSNDGRQ